MKKVSWFIALLCIVILVFGITACTDETPEEVPDTPQEETTDTQGIPSDRIHLVFSLWGDPAELVTTQTALDEYNNMQDKVWVTALQFAQEEYGARLLELALADNMPDCGMVDERTTIGWARNGLLLVYDIYKDAAHKPLDYLAFRDNGETVAYSVANEVLALWFNKDMFDEAGIDYPPITLETAWTWDKFIEVAKKLTLDENGLNPGDPGFDKDNIVQYGAYVNQWAWQLEVWALSNGGRWYSEDGESIVFDDAAIEAMQRVYDLHLIHNVAPYNEATQDRGFLDSVGAGNVAMCTDGQWVTGFAATVDINYGVGVLPYMKEKKNISAGAPAGIFATTKHPAEAADFLKWYSDGETNFGPIFDGWWMPNNIQWFTDETLVYRWIDEAPMRLRLPAAAYRLAVKNVALDTNVTKSAGWYYTPNTDQVDKILIGALIEAINGSKTVKQVIEEVRPSLEAALAG